MKKIMVGCAMVAVMYITYRIHSYNDFVAIALITISGLTAGIYSEVRGSK